MSKPFVAHMRLENSRSSYLLVSETKKNPPLSSFWYIAISV